MKKIVAIIVFLLFTQTKYLLGQQKINKDLKTYYDLSNKFLWAKYKEDYTTAISLFKQLEQIKKPSFSDVQNIIKVYIKIGNKTDANKWIEYSISAFNVRSSMYYKGDEYGLTKEDVLKMPCYLNEKKLFSEFINTDKMQTIGVISHLFENDMLFRNFFEEFKFDDCIKDKQNFVLDIATQYDSIYALPELIKIIRKYNFPNEYDIGSSNLSTFTFMLRHVLSTNSHRLMLDSALYNGKLNPREYGSLVDYLYNYDFKTMLPKNNYGFKLEKTKEGIMQLRYIDNVEEVDKRRAEIGLMPLWQDAKVFRYTLSKQYIDYLKNNNIVFEE